MLRIAILIAGFGLAVQPVPAAPIDTTPSLFSIAVMDSDETDPPVVEGRVSDSTLAEVIGSLGATTYEGQARTSYGINRIAASVSGGAAPADPDDPGLPFTSVLSVWTDWFEFTGLDGIGFTTLSFDVTADLGAADHAQLGYALNTANSAFTVSEAELDAFVYDEVVPQDFVDPDISRDTDSTLDGGGPVRWSGSILHSFTYGQRFYVGSSLFGHAYQDGWVDAFGTARFGISVPDGASLRTGSGTVYPAAVPEPTAGALLLAGLVGLCWTRRRV